jgi:hypothetical protein
MSLAASAVEKTAWVAVEQHLANSPRAQGPRGIYYVGKVLSKAPVSDVCRDQFPRTVVTWQKGNRVDISVAELLALNEIAIPGWAVPFSPWDEPRRVMTRHPREVSSAVPIVSWWDTPRFAHMRFRQKLYKMNLVGISADEDFGLLNFRESEPSSGWYRAHVDSPSWVVPVSLGGFGAFRCKFLDEAGSWFGLLDSGHEVLQWLVALRETAAREPATIDAAHVEALWFSAADKPYEVRQRMIQWDRSPEVRPELKPPRDNNGNLVTFHYTDLTSYETVLRDTI